MQGTDRTMLELLAWITWGALVFGTVGWVATVFVVSSVPTSAGVIAGGAVGGGFGAVVRLLVFTEVEDTSETVTLDFEAEETPGPEPVDLFEAHPDPLVYYDSTGDEPTMLASNPAFAEHFGSDTATEYVPLTEILVGSEVNTIVSAVESGDAVSLDQPVESSGEDAVTTFRVRVVPVGDRTHGYVQYTPVSSDW